MMLPLHVPMTLLHGFSHDFLLDEYSHDRQQIQCVRKGEPGAFHSIGLDGNAKILRLAEVRPFQVIIGKHGLFQIGAVELAARKVVLLEKAVTEVAVGQIEILHLEAVENIVF